VQIVSKKTLALLKRDEDRGGYVNWDVLSREFCFTVSGIISSDIDASIFQRLATLVTEAADDSNFVFELKCIVFFPIILKPGGFQKADFKSHKRLSRGYFVGRNIDHKVWKSARKERRIALAAENLQLSVLDIPDHHLQPLSKLALLSMVEYAANGCR
jgi:hypothetical protein